jgi:hypothetical protein
MEFDQFYVTLPSNASMSIFPDNTKANFITELYKPIKLESKYEVALVEITFPKLERQQNNILGSIEIAKLKHTVNPDDHDSRYFNIYSNDIKNKSLDEIISIINQKIIEAINWKDVVAKPQLIKSKDPNYLHLEFNQFEADLYVLFFGEIADILGFKSSNKSEFRYRSSSSKITGRNIKFENFSNIEFEVNTMFIYTDIIEYQYVGDYSRQILRTVHLDKSNHSICKTYSTPHYVPVATNFFDSIHISIKDGQNNFIKFNSGSEQVIVKLHFRPKKYGF